MPNSRNGIAAISSSLLRASPPLKTLSKASVSLSKASLSNRHHLRVLARLLATRNLIKSLLTFRPLNRRTLKPGPPLWKMLLKTLWVALWPGLSQHLAKLVIHNAVAQAGEVKACEGRGDLVSTDTTEGLG